MAAIGATFEVLGLSVSAVCCLFVSSASPKEVFPRTMEKSSESSLLLKYPGDFPPLLPPLLPLPVLRVATNMPPRLPPHPLFAGAPREMV